MGSMEAQLRLLVAQHRQRNDSAASTTATNTMAKASAPLNGSQMKEDERGPPQVFAQQANVLDRLSAVYQLFSMFYCNSSRKRRKAV